MSTRYNWCRSIESALFLYHAVMKGHKNMHSLHICERAIEKFILLLPALRITHSVENYFYIFYIPYICFCSGKKGSHFPPSNHYYPILVLGIDCSWAQCSCTVEGHRFGHSCCIFGHLLYLWSKNQLSKNYDLSLRLCGSLHRALTAKSHKITFQIQEINC